MARGLTHSARVGRTASLQPISQGSRYSDGVNNRIRVLSAILVSLVVFIGCIPVLPTEKSWVEGGPQDSGGVLELGLEFGTSDTLDVVTWLVPDTYLVLDASPWI